MRATCILHKTFSMWQTLLIGREGKIMLERKESYCVLPWISFPQDMKSQYFTLRTLANVAGPDDGS